MSGDECRVCRGCPLPELSSCTHTKHLGCRSSSSSSSLFPFHPKLHPFSIPNISFLLLTSFHSFPPFLALSSHSTFLASYFLPPYHSSVFPRPSSSSSSLSSSLYPVLSITYEPSTAGNIYCCELSQSLSRKE